MNAEDMQREGLEENDYVSLRNETGKMLDLKVRAYNIPLGNLLTYFPESNVLIPKTTDQRSKTPSYKSVLVENSLAFSFINEVLCSMKSPNISS